MKIVVAGGTGFLGRKVVEAALAAGHDPISLSRSDGVDLVTGAGLVAALGGADAVIDASARAVTSSKESLAFFPLVTQSLLAAEREAGVGHHVAISIIGAAEIATNYYAGKAAQEEVLMGTDGGWSMLRTTQFHEFVIQLITGGKMGPFQAVPRMRSQPIAAAEVAAELIRIAEGGPIGVAPALAGPSEERMSDLVRRYLAATGTSRPVLELSIPGAWGRGMRDGTLLPAAGTRLGRQTFDEWLSVQTG